MMALDTLNPMKSGIKLFNMGKENRIYEPLKLSLKSSMWDKYERERERGRKVYLIAIKHIKLVKICKTMTIRVCSFH